MTDGTIAVLSPSVNVSITIETGTVADEIHVHAGGQGIWVARMLRQLDHQPRVCAPIGGESGRTLLGLVGAWGIQLRAVETIADTPAYVHDRRGGERVELARSRPPELQRHEVDEFYNRFLQLALAAGRCVVTGPASEGVVPDEVYGRLGSDLAAADVEVVADLHGDQLERFLDGGPIRVLKVSAVDLVADGRLSEDDASGQEAGPAIAELARRLRERGVETVVISRGGEPTLAWAPDGAYAVTGPALDVVDGRGSGDSMTAALAASVADGLEVVPALARAWAAGAANVTRRGLGSGIPGLITELTERAIVTRYDDP
jgi:1-phosphofructokinase